MASSDTNEIDQMLSDLQLAEFIYEQPALPDLEYIFKHALTQDVAYNSILLSGVGSSMSARRRSIESLYADRIDDHLAEFAHHYGRSGNYDKAVEFLARSAATGDSSARPPAKRLSHC